MQQSKLSVGQASVAASGILVLLALTVPFIGLLLLPVVGVRTLARAIRDSAPVLGIPKPRWPAAGAVRRAFGPVIG